MCFFLDQSVMRNTNIFGKKPKSWTHPLPGASFKKSETQRIMYDQSILLTIRMNLLDHQKHISIFFALLTYFKTTMAAKVNAQNGQKWSKFYKTLTINLYYFSVILTFCDHLGYLNKSHTSTTALGYIIANVVNSFVKGRSETL